MAKNSDEFNKAVGLRVLRKREELGLTQDELAKRVGYKTKQSIYYIENGLRSMNPDQAMKLAKALGVSINYIMGDEEAPDEISTEAITNYLVRKGYIKPGEDLSDADLLFIETQLESIASWFKNKNDSRK